MAPSPRCFQSAAARMPPSTTALSIVRPFRTTGGYRRFTTEMLKDIAICCRNHHWFSWEKLQTTLRELAIAAYRDTGAQQIRS